MGFDRQLTRAGKILPSRKIAERSIFSGVDKQFVEAGKMVSDAGPLLISG